MPIGSNNLEQRLAALDRDLVDLGTDLPGAVASAVDRWRTDAAALRFHLRGPGKFAPLVAILGGTGTGKSTVVNRLLEAKVSATSFRRTFTAGAVAITSDVSQVPADWLAVRHQNADAKELPARGQPESLIVVASPQPLVKSLTLIDTPDLDGDQPEHHIQADRVFRWASGVVFLVTPEKYQMTELLPYYRLAQRYAVPVIFAMNKCEENEVLADYARQLESGFGYRVAGAGENGNPPSAKAEIATRLFAIPRDDTGWSPPTGADLPALREAITSLHVVAPATRDVGLQNRSNDLLGRLTDQVVAPLRDARREADRLIVALRNMEAPEPGVDVNPISHQLQRRLQQRSILYLMGPGRIIERVRQVPGMMIRLPRTLWDTVIRGKKIDLGTPQSASAEDSQVPDFRANLVDQFAVIQSRMDDALRSNVAAARWILERTVSFSAAHIPPEDAGKIVDEELGDLRSWLEKRWNATPRDTLLILRLLRHLPGGQKLVQYFEATPYLLAIIMATHHWVSGGADLMIVGGYSLATWITEKLSNEVTNRVRLTNRRIGERFAQLGHQQIEKLCQWLEKQAPSAVLLDRLEQAANELGEERDEGTKGPRHEG